MAAVQQKRRSAAIARRDQGSKQRPRHRESKQPSLDEWAEWSERLRRQWDPERFAPLIRRLNARGLNRPCVLNADEASIVADALWLAHQYHEENDSLQQQRYNLSALISYALAALRESGSTETRLRRMANRLLWRPDDTRIRDHRKPAEAIVRAWYTLTREGTDPKGCPVHADWPQVNCRRCPDPYEKVSVTRQEAILAITERYEFRTDVACVKFLERQGVRGLPMIQKD